MTQDAGHDPLILSFVLGGEIAFWVVLLAGLLARYAFRRRRLGGILLLCVPLVDLVLVVVSIVDLVSGGEASLTHSLAAAYLGVSVAFGPELVRRADARFAHRYGEGPPPPRPPRYGWEKVRYEWRMWGRCAAALAIAAALTGVMYLVAGPEANALALWNFQVQLAVVTVVWFVGWPLRLTLFPPRPPSGAGETRSVR